MVQPRAAALGAHTGVAYKELVRAGHEGTEGLPVTPEKVYRGAGWAGWKAYLAPGGRPDTQAEVRSEVAPALAEAAGDVAERLEASASALRETVTSARDTEDESASLHATALQGACNAFQAMMAAEMIWYEQGAASDGRGRLTAAANGAARAVATAAIEELLSGAQRRAVVAEVGGRAAAVQVADAAAAEARAALAARPAPHVSPVVDEASTSDADSPAARALKQAIAARALLGYVPARDFALTLHCADAKAFRAWQQDGSPGRPRGFPSDPMGIYQALGQWLSWTHFLGYSEEQELDETGAEMYE